MQKIKKSSASVIEYIIEYITRFINNIHFLYNRLTYTPSICSDGFETIRNTDENRKKILFIIYNNDVGGAEYVSYQHIKACAELGYKPVVLSGTKGMFFEKIKKLPIVDLYYSDFRKISTRRRLDILYTISNECEIIYNCNDFSVTPLIRLLKIFRIFKYYTIAHADVNILINALIRYDSITDKYIVIHDKIRYALNKKSVKNSRIITIPNFIDFDQIRKIVSQVNPLEIREKLGISKDAFVIGMVTRIAPDKNIMDAVKVLQGCGIDNAVLLILGDASSDSETQDYKKRVIRYVNETGLSSRVIFAGVIPQEEIYKYVKCFNIAFNISPSEGLPIALLEQMACGIHAIYPSHGEIPDVLEGYGSVIEVEHVKDTGLVTGGDLRYDNRQIQLFINEIRRVYRDGGVPSAKIINGFRHTRNAEIIYPYLDLIFGGYKSGLSFLIRARNEEKNIKNCLLSIVDIAYEIILVDHLSTDSTFEIALELSKKYSNIRVFKYRNEIPKPGKNYHKNIRKLKNSISEYYNFCLTKVTCKNVVKWDADFIAQRENLLEMISIFDLRNRSDKYLLWFTGETVFSTANGNYVNKNSYYDEYRSFSLEKGFFWQDYERCEGIARKYLGDAITMRFEKPCFYEIKRIAEDEFIYRDSLIDRRDVTDFNIISSLRNDIVPENLQKVDISVD